MSQPTLRLARHATVDAFARHAAPFLLAHEAEHNLILGLTAGLGDDAALYDAPPYLATVTDGDAVVAVAFRTPPFNLILSRAPTAALPLVATDACSLFGRLPGVIAPRALVRAFADIWHGLSGQAWQPGFAQRIYQLDAVTPMAGVPGSLRRATHADRALLAEWFLAFDIETFGRGTREQAEREVEVCLTAAGRAVYLWLDDRPASLAVTSGPTPHGIRVGRVYTPPELRGRGYASACVAAVSQAQLDAGRRHCFLFTNLANPTSNRIYQRIGYRPVADVDEYRFLPAAGR